MKKLITLLLAVLFLLSAVSAPADDDPAFYAVGCGCTVDGETFVRLEAETDVTAVAELPEGYVVDHWELNGEAVSESGTEVVFTVRENTVIEAVIRLENKITCINCYFQFATDKPKAKGEKYTEVSFEAPYTNPVTGMQCEAGHISGYVIADVPRNMQVDYWIINGVEYHPSNSVKNFRIVNLDEATVYEVVFKGASKKSTAKPAKIDPARRP